MTKQTTKTTTATTGDAAAQIGSKAKTKAATVSHAKPKVAPKAKPTKQEQAAKAVARMRQAALDIVQPSPVAEIVQLPVNFVRCVAQVRTEFNDETIAELASDIAANGIIQPIIVRRTEDAYIVVAGERRLRAAKMAELEMIPAIIADLDGDRAAAVQIAENIQREDLSLADTAKAVRQLYELNGNSVTDTAARLHKSKSWISKHLAASCPDLGWTARRLLEDGSTEDLEIILTVNKIARLDWRKAGELETEIRAGRAGRKNVLDAYAKVKAEVKKEEAERKAQQLTPEQRKAKEKAAKEEEEREQREYKERQEKAAAAVRLDPMHLRWKDVKTLEADQREVLTAQLKEIYETGHEATGPKMRRMAINRDDFTDLEVMAFLHGFAGINFDLDRMQREIDEAFAD